MMPNFDAPGYASSPADRQCILIVEDEVLIRLLIGDELREAGYEVIEACDGDEAMSLLQRPVRIDLILSDVRMPGTIDGLALLARMKEERPATPFILMSGHLQPRLAEFAGATTFLPKPFSFNVAVDAVRKALETSL